jgi:catechol 2,3-dioxygenase-like lactoylglutathione lyase family enzyme
MADTETTPKATSVAYVRFNAPDLAAAETFLTAFGLIVAERGDGVVWFRGASSTPFNYVLTEGEPGFAGVGFTLEDRAALEAFSKRWETPIASLDGPGQGHFAALADPDGFRAEACVFGAPAAELPVRPTLPANTAGVSPRLGEERRIALETAKVWRLGHAVLQVPDLRRTEAWYKERFGLLTSDDIVDVDGVSPLGVFLRLNRGPIPTDHHTLFLITGERAAFHHAAFEVSDLDDLMVGHDRLQRGGYTHHRGVGRHLLGSQIYDYWRDPWGHVLEHWTDGDYFDAAWGPRVSTAADLRGDGWRSTADQ